MTDFDILMTGPLPPIIVTALDKAARLHRLWEAPDRDALIARVGASVRALATGNTIMVDDAFAARFPKLEIVASYGVGYDKIDAAAMARRNIVVTNTPGVLNEEVADTALGLLLCTVRELPRAERFLRAGHWMQKAFPLTATLRGRTMGIVGLGRIGKAIARRAEAFGLSVVYHGRKAQPDAPYLYYPTLLGMAEAVDILMVVTPGGAATTHLINAPVLAALGNQGVLINVARGSVVDEAALIAALQSKTISAAGLDVFANEPRVPQALIEMDNVVLLPHVASASHETRRAMAQLVIDNLAHWAAGNGPLTPVAETPWPKTAADAGA